MGRKGATLSDKTAHSEYGLMQEEIDADKLQCRPAARHGNPWLRLLRREVEDLVTARSGHLPGRVLRFHRDERARLRLRSGLRAVGGGAGRRRTSAERACRSHP